MPPTDSRRLLVVLAVSLVARVAVLAPGFGSWTDPDLYLPIARSLARGEGFSFGQGIPTAHRPPLYPLVVAPLVAMLEGRGLALGIAALHVALGIGTVALTYLVARRWGYGPDRAAIASLVVGLDPVVLVQARSVMTETLATLCVAACLAAVTIPGKRGALISGLAFGLSSLCRPSLLPGAMLAGVGLVATGPGERRRRGIEGACFLLGLALVLAPWAIRNQIRFGEMIVTTTHGGYTLALANNPVYYADVLDGPPGAVWSGPNQAAWFAWADRVKAGRSEAEADRVFQAEGWRMLRERPRAFLRASVARLGRFWGIAPAGAVYAKGLRIATAVWTAPLWIALALGLTRRDAWRWPALAAPLAIVGLTAVHAVYWTDMRMRVPVVPSIALVAAGAGLASGKKGELRRISAGQIGASR